MIPNAEGARTAPSVVAITEGGERLVGQLARRQAILNPKGTIYSAKRFVGQRFEEVAEEAAAESAARRLKEFGVTQDALLSALTGFAATSG